MHFYLLRSNVISLNFSRRRNDPSIAAVLKEWNVEMSEEELLQFYLERLTKIVLDAKKRVKPSTRGSIIGKKQKDNGASEHGVLLLLPILTILCGVLVLYSVVHVSQHNLNASFLCRFSLARGL